MPFTKYLLAVFVLMAASTSMAAGYKTNYKNESKWVQAVIDNANSRTLQMAQVNALISYAGAVESVVNKPHVADQYVFLKITQECLRRVFLPAGEAELKNVHALMSKGRGLAGFEAGGKIAKASWGMDTETREEVLKLSCNEGLNEVIYK